MPKILSDVALCLGAALGVVLLFRRFNLPSVAGFLLAGMLIGPSGLGLIGDPAEVQDVAELGIVLLLFAIGLDVSLRRIVGFGRFLIGAGPVQLGLTALAGGAFLAARGTPWSAAALLGFAVALSSTAIVLKVLSARGEMAAPHGLLALGVLIFQDLAVIPAMALLAVLAAGGAGSPAAAAVAVGKALAGMAALLFAGRHIAPRLFAHAVRSRSREAFSLLVVFLLLGTAWLASRFGLSLAMGAFLAGLILAESDYGPQALAEIVPVKETFSGLFFTSLGMLLDLRFAVASAGALLGLAVLVVAGKALLSTLACRLVHPSWRISLAAGLVLAQVGEFALVIAAAALPLGLVSSAEYQVLLAVTVLTMLLSPFLISSAHALSLHLARRLAGPAGSPQAAAGDQACTMRGHVVIVGYGLNGANLARVLTATGIPFLVLDLNPVLVEAGQRAGHDVRYGDGTLGEVLRAVETQCARVLVVAISDPLATRQIVAVARTVNPAIHIVVRTRFFSEIEELTRLGADEVIAEEFETSVEIFTRVLRELLVPRNVIAIQVDLVRREGYGMLRGLRMPSRLKDQLAHILAARAVDNIQLLEGSPAIGRTQIEMSLHESTGAGLVAVIRNGKAFTNPPSDWRFVLGDILVVIGAHSEVDAAERLLSGGPAAPSVTAPGRPAP
jgi:monovalent cation:H+ antiporter-2, CPA2 family